MKPAEPKIKIYINIHYNLRQPARKEGAKFDILKKKWYIHNEDLDKKQIKKINELILESAAI